MQAQTTRLNVHRSPCLRNTALTHAHTRTETHAHATIHLLPMACACVRAQTLCLADNGLGPEGAAALCTALLQRQQQQQPQAGAAAGAGAGSSSGLKVLDLSLNQLGDEGAKVRVGAHGRCRQGRLRVVKGNTRRSTRQGSGRWESLGGRRGACRWGGKVDMQAQAHTQTCAHALAHNA